MMELENPLVMFLKAFATQTLGYFVVVTVVFVGVWILGARRFQGRRIQPTRRFNAAQWRRELLHTFVTLGTGTATAVVISILFAAGQTRLTLEMPSLPVLLLSAFGMIVFNDAWFYGWHRALHHPTLFKYVHSVHHRSIDVNPYSSYSFHFVEALILGAWVIPFVMFVPFSIPTLGLIQTVGLANNVMSHLGYEFLPRWLIRVPPFRWMNSATFHNLHHTSFNGNYGLFFRWWDLWLGTQVPGYEQRFVERGAALTEQHKPQ